MNQVKAAAYSGHFHQPAKPEAFGERTSADAERDAQTPPPKQTVTVHSAARVAPPSTHNNLKRVWSRSRFDREMTAGPQTHQVEPNAKRNINVQPLVVETLPFSRSDAKHGVELNTFAGTPGPGAMPLLDDSWVAEIKSAIKERNLGQLKQHVNRLSQLAPVAHNDELPRIVEYLGKATEAQLNVERSPWTPYVVQATGNGKALRDLRVRIEAAELSAPNKAVLRDDIDARLAEVEGRLTEEVSALREAIARAQNDYKALEKLLESFSRDPRFQPCRDEIHLHMARLAPRHFASQIALAARDSDIHGDAIRPILKSIPRKLLGAVATELERIRDWRHPHADQDFRPDPLRPYGISGVVRKQILHMLKDGLDPLRPANTAQNGWWGGASTFVRDGLMTFAGGVAGAAAMAALAIGLESESRDEFATCITVVLGLGMLAAGIRATRLMSAALTADGKGKQAQADRPTVAGRLRSCAGSGLRYASMLVPVAATATASYGIGGLNNAVSLNLSALVRIIMAVVRDLGTQFSLGGFGRTDLVLAKPQSRDPHRYNSVKASLIQGFERRRLTCVFALYAVASVLVRVYLIPAMGKTPIGGDPNASSWERYQERFQSELGQYLPFVALEAIDGLFGGLSSAMAAAWSNCSRKADMKVALAYVPGSTADMVRNFSGDTKSGRNVTGGMGRTARSESFARSAAHASMRIYYAAVCINTMVAVQKVFPHLEHENWFQVLRGLANAFTEFRGTTVGMGLMAEQAISDADIEAGTNSLMRELHRHTQHFFVGSDGPQVETEESYPSSPVPPNSSAFSGVPRPTPSNLGDFQTPAPRQIRRDSSLDIGDHMNGSSDRLVVEIRGFEAQPTGRERKASQ